MARKTIEIPTPDEIKDMTTVELRKLVTKLNSAANKRLRRLEKTGLFETSWSYAVVRPTLESGKFSVKGANTRQQLTNRLKSVSAFLSHSSSTVTGARKENIRITKLFGGRTNKFEIRKIAKMVNEMRQASPSLFNIVGSERMFKYVSEQLDRFNEMSIDDILSEAQQFMNKVYEERHNPSYKRGKNRI